MKTALSGIVVPLMFRASENSELLGGGVSDSGSWRRNGMAWVVAKRPKSKDAAARYMMKVVSR